MSVCKACSAAEGHTVDHGLDALTDAVWHAVRSLTSDGQGRTVRGGAELLAKAIDKHVRRVVDEKLAERVPVGTCGADANGLDGTRYVCRREPHQGGHHRDGAVSWETPERTP